MANDKNLFLGIDIGSSSLKIALLSKGKGGRIKLLKAVCDSFTVAPEECSTVLSGETPSAGFGYEVGSSDDGSCG